MRPVYSKTSDTRLAGLERSVRFLLRREQLPNPHTDTDLGGGGTGIQFDVDPQEGNFLHVSTDGGVGGGIEVTDTGDGNTASSGIKIMENGSDVITILNAGDGSAKGGPSVKGIEIRNAGNGSLVIRQTGDGGLTIQDDGTAPLEIHSTGAGIVINSHGFPISIDTGGGGLTVDGTPVP